MVANGQPIPGVRTDIDDKPLDPNAKLEKGSRDSATKVINFQKLYKIF